MGVISSQSSVGSGKYKTYPEYKDSGVEWLGDLPAHWKMMRLKQTSSIQTGIAKGKDLSQVEGKIKVPYLRVANVQDGYLKLDTVSEIEIKTEELNRYRLQSGDMLMNEGGAIWRGQVENCIHQNHVFAVRPTLVEPEWLNWLTQTEYAKFHFYRVAKQSTNLASISSTNIGELPMVVPPEMDRSSIINFLDHETAKIDTLIEEQQSLIRLLKEKRQAVISHAVTKGLPSITGANAPMKDSGVEWLGEVPEHWKKKSIKRLFKLAKRQGFSDLEVLSVYREYGVIKKSSRTDNNNKTPEDLSSYQLVEQGDLVINKMKAWQGSLGISDDKGITSPDYLVFRALQPKLGPFLHLSLRASHMPDTYLSISNGIRLSQWRLETEKFETLEIYIPPEHERTEIVAFVNKQRQLLEKLRGECMSAIEWMQERRTALISAAVTGKIDVRDWVAPEQKQKATV